MDKALLSIPNVYGKQTKIIIGPSASVGTNQSLAIFLLRNSHLQRIPGTVHVALIILMKPSSETSSSDRTGHHFPLVVFESICFVKAFLDTQ